MAQAKQETKRAKQPDRARFGGTMPTALYERVKASAKADKRKIQAEIEHIIEWYFQHEGHAA